MKRFPTIPAAVLAAAVLILAGCGIADTDGPDEKLANRADVSAIHPSVTARTTTTTAAPVAKTPTPEDRFIETLDEYGVDYGTTDEGILAGHTTCLFIDEGGSPAELIYEMAFDPTGGQVLPNISNDELPLLMGAAIGALCPEHMDVIENLG